MNKFATLQFVFLILILSACGGVGPTPEVIAPTSAPTDVPTQVPTTAPTNTPRPTAIPPTPTQEPTAEPSPTAGNTPDKSLPYIGELLWSPDLGIAADLNIGQFANEMLLTIFFANLYEDGPFTIFAPTYSYREDIPAGLSSEQYFEALEAHIVPGMYLEEDLLAMDGQTIATSTEGRNTEGRNIEITVVDGVVHLNGIAMLTQADVLAGNGVIHVIDKFLLPPTD